MVVTTLTIIALLTGGGGLGDHVSVIEMLQEMSSLIEEHVEDPASAARSQEVIEAMRIDLLAYAEQLVTMEQELVAVDRDHGATPEDFERVFADFDAVWDATERRLIEGQFELREHIDAEEWAAIYADLGKKLK